MPSFAKTGVLLGLTLLHLGTGCGSGGDTPLPAPPPAVLSVTPATGTDLGGTPVTVLGSGFAEHGAGTAEVTFGGASAGAVLVVDDTTLTCITPPGADGAASVRVTNARGTGARADGYLFRGPRRRILDATGAHACRVLSFPGLALGAVDDDTSYTSFHGVARTSTGLPPDEDSVFPLASLSKPFGGMVLAQMLEEGAVNLDDLAESIVPATFPTHASAPSRLITFRDLITHSSGLPSYMPTPAAAGEWLYTPAEVYAALPGITLPFVPGSAHGYSNLGSGLVGHAMALRAGLPTFDEVLALKLTGPLGMPSTRTVPTASMEARLVDGFSDMWGTIQPFLHTATFDSGAGVHSSPRDLLTLIHAHLAPVEDVPVGPALARALTEHWTGGGWSMGLAWIRNPPWAWHNGSLPGTGTILGVDATHRRGLFVLENRQDGEGRVEALYNRLQEHMDGRPLVVPLPLSDGMDGTRTFAGSVEVQILCWDPAATVRWTHDGSDPIADSPAYAGPIVVEADVTLRARAFVGGSPVGPVVVAAFDRIADAPAAATAVATPRPGLDYRFYGGGMVSVTQIPVDDPPDQALVVERVTADLALIQGGPGCGNVYEGYLRIPHDDVWRFDMHSNDGSRLYIDDQLVVDADTSRPASGVIGLAAGHHAVRVLFAANGFDSKLVLQWSSSSTARVEVPPAAFFR